MRTFFTSALLLSVTAMLWCQPSGLQEAAQHQNRAASLLLNGDFESAIRELEAAANLYEAAQEWEYYFSCLNQSTNAYLNIGMMEEAKRTAKKALWQSIQRLGRDNDEAAKAAHRLAEVYSRAGRHAKAIEVHNMGLMIRESIYGARHTRLADSYDWLARAWEAADDYEKAAEFYSRAMSLRTALLGEQHPDVATSHTNLAGLELARKNYQAALSHYQAACDISRGRLGENHPDVAAALVSMARINRRLGDRELAARQYREAALLYRQLPDSRGELPAEAFYELALLDFEKGKLHSAHFFAKAAIQSLPTGAAEHPERKGSCHQLLGAILLESGQYQAAAGAFRLALEAPEGASSYSNYYEQWCEALRLSGSLPEALAAARAFLEWAEREEAPYAILKARTQLGSLLIEDGQAEAGIQQLAQVLNRGDAPFWLLQEASFSLGEAYRRQGEHEQAIQQYKQLAAEWEQSRQAGAAFFRFKALMAMGMAHTELARQDRNTLFNLEAALDAFHSCDRILNSLLHSPLPTEQLVFLIQGQNRLYGNAIGACFSLYQQNQEERYLTEAFYFSERSKQLNLCLPLHLLPPTRFAQAPQPLLEREAVSKTSVQFLFRHLKESRIRLVAADSIRGEIEKRETEYKEVLAELKQKAPQYYQLKFGCEAVAREEVSALLSREAAMLYSYFVDEAYLYVFHLTGTGLQLFQWPMDNGARSTLRDLIQLVLKGRKENRANNTELEYRQMTALAVQLYQKLLPGKPEQSGQHIYLLPHGELQWLPFEALLPEAPSEGTFAALPYLGLSHSLSYHPSATALMNGLKEGPAPSYASAFDAFVFEVENSQVAMKGAYTLGEGAPPSLDYFLELARGWAADYEGSLWEGPKGSEAVFRSLSPSALLLLALHTQAGSSLEDTFISFSGRPDSTSDNRLYLKEAYGIEKEAALYILASVQPRLPESAGWQQLAEALRYSGARSLLVHRGPAAGRPSAELLGLFLSRWKASGNTPEALLEARRDYLARQANSPEKAHPHYWAGYAAYGAHGEEPAAAGIPRFWIVAAVAGLILIGWLVRLH